jgi:predicted DNA repair protein MutK
MASGILALLDDVAAIAKLATASLDDIGVAAMRAGSKSAGVVIDDAAVTPAYVTGLEPARELPIIWRITKGSLFNKVIILLPLALILSAFLPFLITPILMLGGAYLCYEGAEKVVEKLSRNKDGQASSEIDHAPYEDPKALEDEKVAGAVRTDLILSAEIMAIALGEISDSNIFTQAVVLFVVGVAITAGVYGAVAVIVKMDDIGLHLAKSSRGLISSVGNFLVRAMPVLLATLSVVGTAAMLWVGGGIIIHGMEVFGLGWLPHLFHGIADTVGSWLPVVSAAISWIVNAVFAGLFGLALGYVIVLIHHRFAGAKEAH